MRTHTVCAAVCAAILFLAGPAGAEVTLDFDDLDPGDIVSTISTPFGDVTVNGFRPDDPMTNHAVIFDTNNINMDPGSGLLIDVDLGSPNATCTDAGPGQSIDGAGEVGGTHPNCLDPEGPLAARLNNVMIVADNLVDGDMNGQVDLPNDFNGEGELMFIFPRAVDFHAITLLDIQADEDETASLKLFSDAAGTMLVAELFLDEMGDNGVTVFEFPTIGAVRRLEVDFEGSGAIDNIVLSFCGDGSVDDGEECDDGDDNSDTEPDACRTDCTLPRCGDGVVDADESCDGDAAGTDCAGPCRDDCTCCGDGVVNGDEECDDGADNSDSAADACRTDCTLPRCGDGVTDSGESCDGDDAAGCNDDCRDDCTCCGDDVVNGDEECDGDDGDCGSCVEDVLTFDDFEPGEIITSIDTAIGPVAVEGIRPGAPGSNYAIAFDTNNINTDPGSSLLVDVDLGSPNETCTVAGPGQSNDGAGEVGGSHPNCLDPEGPLTALLNNVLIVADNLDGSMMDGIVDLPNDFNGEGELIFIFPVAVEFTSITLLDIQADEDEAASLKLYTDAAGTMLMDELFLDEMGDNGAAVFNFPPAGPVRRLEVDLEGSGAIDNVGFRACIDDGGSCNDACMCGGFCGDGILDPGEECDDGDGNSDTEPNACRTDCTLPRCGDGVKDSNESCDGLDDSFCVGPCRDDCTCCGDDMVNGDDEVCDGNDADACAEVCIIEVIRFEEFAAGEIVSEITSVPNLGTVSVEGFRPDDPMTNYAVTFPSAAPPGLDFDLGSPNETCGGPGVSNDGIGEITGANPNCLAPDGPLAMELGNLLIVADNLDGSAGDGIVDVPNDFNGEGELKFIFDFAVKFDSITLLDIQADEDEAASLKLFSDAAGTILIEEIFLDTTGDNGLIIFEFPPIEGVRRLEVDLEGSGAIDNIMVEVCSGGGDCLDNCQCEGDPVFMPDPITQSVAPPAGSNGRPAEADQQPEADTPDQDGTVEVIEDRPILRRSANRRMDPRLRRR